MIYDLRSTIAGSGPGGVEYFRQFFSFNSELRKPRSRKQSRSFHDLNPESCFISLFENCRDLVDEIRSRLAAKCGAVIGRNGTSAARDLVSNGSPGRLARQGISQFEHTNGKLNRSLLEFAHIHARQYSRAASIINPES
jgi:hypothetical protein